MPVNYSFLRKALFFLLLLVFALEPAGAGRAEEVPWYGAAWTHERSEIRPDPKVHFGTLGNKMRYAIVPNKVPPGQLYLALNVQAGSLMENEHEQGYAHFLEHMAFNGSRNFPAGSLVPLFQKHGMQFGNDANAYTTQTETVYTLNLTAITPESLDMALKVLRDFADGLNLDDEEVKKELGVILAEKNSRESEAAKAALHHDKIFYGGTKFANHPIGTEECLKNADGAALRAFYHKWYKPERMVLVAAGDAVPAELAEKIEAVFGDLRPSGSAPTIDTWGTPQTPELRGVLHQRPVNGANISITVLHPREHYRDSTNYKHGLIVDMVAEFCFSRRLNRRVESAPEILSGANFYAGRRHGLLPQVRIRADAATERWANAVKTLAEELRNAQEHGFSQDEVDQAVSYLARTFETEVRDQGNRHNRRIVSGLIRAVNTDRVYTSPEEDLDFFKTVAPSINVGTVHNAFKEMFAPANRTVYISGNMHMPEGEKDILAAWRKALATPPRKGDMAEVKNFPYLPLPGKAAELPHLVTKKPAEDAPELLEAALPNGLKLYFIPGEHEKKQISATLLFASGVKTLPDSEYPVAQMAGRVLRESGLGGFGRVDTEFLLGGRRVSIGETYGSSFAQIHGSGGGEDLEFILQAMWTQYKDPRPTEAARQQVLQRVLQAEHAMFNTVDGASRNESSRFFYGPAKRFAQLDAATASGISLEQITAFITGTRQGGPSHLILSGDFNPQDALTLAAALFGPEDPPLPVAGTQWAYPAFPVKGRAIVPVGDVVDKAFFTLAWQCDPQDEADRKLLAARRLAGSALQNRLREELREEMGVSYGPFAYYSVSFEDQGHGILAVGSGLEIQHLEAAKKSALRVAEKLAENGISEKELEFLREPLRNQLRNARKTVANWHDLVLQEIMSGKPYVRWQNEYLPLLNSIEASDVSQAARSMIVSDKMAELSVFTKKRE